MMAFPVDPPVRPHLHRGRIRSFHALLLRWTLLLSVLVDRAVWAQVSGTIDVWPANSTVTIGTPKQFGAYVPIAPNTVGWYVNGILGGNAALGTVSPSGLYQAPAVAPANNALTITVQSTAYPTSFKSTTLTVTRPYPWLWRVSPATLQAGGFSVSLNGSNFAPDSVVQANGVDLPTTYVSPTKLWATGTAAQGTLVFRVRQPGPGPVTGNTVSVAVTIVVVVSPSSPSVSLGHSQAFTSTVTGAVNTAVTWSVPGGVANGTISAAGVYLAPAAMPGAAAVKVRATSVANPLQFAEAAVTLTAPPVVVTVNPGAATVALSTAKTFGALVTGTPNTAVTWSVLGGSANGTISPVGVYTPPAGLPATPTVTVRATSVAQASAFGEAIITLTAAPDYAARIAAARLLEQSSFGPTESTLALVQQLGVSGYLTQQMALPATLIPAPSVNGSGILQQWMLYNATTAPDQLRQRVAYALSQIIVVAINKNVYPEAMTPWMNSLSQQAFGNYRDLLRDTARSSSMGKFLDLANSTKPGPRGGANENFPRELLQLFSIGLWELNQDGTLKADPNGQALSTYTQNDVAQLALALTGWTYATAPGASPRDHNNEYHGAPMETRLVNHDLGSKSFLGAVIPAGQTVEQDLESVLDVLMTHPNIAPFVATRLIRSLVMSNPSPGFVQRVAAVFASSGGQMRSVILAILTDPEARNDTPTVNGGRLKEPILQIAGFLRALNGSFTANQQLTYLFTYMAQSPLNAPSVFGWYSPLYRVPKRPLFGPEFQIYTPTEAALRGNFFHYILGSSGGDFVIDLSPYQPYGNDMSGLVELANQRLLHGRMPAGMKQVLMDAAAPGYDAKTRIETVLYLTALSGQYAVQH